MKTKATLSTMLLTLFLLVAAGAARAQQTDTAASHSKETVGDTVTFRFPAKQDMFYTPWGGNGTELVRLATFISRHRAAIADGRLPLHVDSYCASLPTRAENLATARLRALRVKSELILRHGLAEEHFVTALHAGTWGGRRDVVTVTAAVPAAEAAATADAASTAAAASTNVQPEGRLIAERDSSASGLKRTEEESLRMTEEESLRMIGEESAMTEGEAAPYLFALRTNLFYDALLLPTLGIEWRITCDWSLRLDGSRSWWGRSSGTVQKIWLLSPEIRRYLLADRRFYVGVSANYAEYNLYGRPLGKLLSDDTGYQGRLWSVGLTLGYQLPLWRSLALDFNLGLGYTRSEYDSFTVPYGVRIFKQRDRRKNFFGPTQAGISLVWTIGGKGIK